MNMSAVAAAARLDAAGSYEASFAGNRFLWWRRASFVVPVLAATAGGTWLAAQATAASASPLRPVLLALVALNLLYMALTGWPTVLGALLHLARRRLAVAAAPSGQSRTAVVMPVYNESPVETFAAMEAMARAVAEAALPGVDFFILSDTRDPAIAAAEQAAFDRVHARLPAEGPRFVYRRRHDNAGRKVGNLLEFCSRWGADYDYMLVLDADSLMGVSAIATLVGLMDTNPRAGIIQTVPYAVGRETPFARFLQFSARLYTPLLVEGLTFWQGGDGNYWGHNAIVRIAPFVEHCRLPVLPGREPFGGEILCHDVVEAGLMRAAGWEVWVLPQTLESFEAVPANLVDFAARERRWCQGNLQHAGVLPDRRLRPVGRFHLAYGIFHYLAAPVAVLFLLLATADAVSGGDAARLLLDPGSPPALALAALAAFLLYACKLGTLAITLLDGAASRAFGGRWRLVASAVAEQAGALVITAVLLWFYTQFTLSLLRGRSVRWDAQPRDDRGLTWAEAGKRLRAPTSAGVLWAAALLWGAPDLLPWAAPLLLGFLLCVPAAVLSSRAELGRSLRWAGVFEIPEERSPAPILRSQRRLVAGPATTLPSLGAAPFATAESIGR